MRYSFLGVYLTILALLAACRATEQDANARSDKAETTPGPVGTGPDSARVLASGAAAGSGPQRPCDQPLVVDFRARAVAGIPLDTTAAHLAALLGPARVTVDTAYPEGHPSAVYVIDFCGHTLRRTWNAVSWSDSAFRTGEGLGVGSRIQDFDRSFGEGEGTWGEGPAVRYRTGRGHFFLRAGGECFAPEPGRVVVDRACRVTGVSVIVTTSP